MHATTSYPDFASELNAIAPGWIRYPLAPKDVAMHMGRSGSPVILSRKEVLAHGRNGNRYVKEKMGLHEEQTWDFYRGRVQKRSVSGFTSIEKNIINGIMSGPHRPLKDDKGDWLSSGGS